MTHILEDLTHKMEGQPPENTGQMVSIGIYTYFMLYILHASFTAWGGTSEAPEIARGSNTRLSNSGPMRWRTPSGVCNG